MARWAKHKLDDVCTLKSGTSVKKALEKGIGDLPYIKVADMTYAGNECEIVSSSRFLDRKDIGRNAVFPPGTTIFPKRGGAILTNKKRLTAVPICADLNVMGVIPGKDLLPCFLYFYFLGVDMRQLGSGSSIPQINNYDIAPLQIPLPPLPEQERIVSVLDEAFAAIATATANAEKNRDNARELFESELDRVFSQKGEGWVEKALGEEIDLLTGFAFKSKNYTTAEDGVKLLRGDNIIQGQLRWKNAKHWPNNDTGSYAKYSLEEQDVVLAMDRTWIKAGLKYAHISERDLPCLLVQRVARLRATPCIDSRFLAYLIGSPSFTRYVLSIQTGLGVPHISGKQIAGFTFFRPELSEQKAISSKLNTLAEHTQRLESIYEQKLTALAELKQSILHKAFTGELTADWRAQLAAV